MRLVVEEGGGVVVFVRVPVIEDDHEHVPRGRGIVYVTDRQTWDEWALAARKIHHWRSSSRLRETLRLTPLTG